MGERCKTTGKDGNEGVMLIVKMAANTIKTKYYLC